MARKRITRRDFIKATGTGVLAAGLGTNLILPARSHGASAKKTLKIIQWVHFVPAFDKCAKLAANRGINVAWEFEPGFPLNKPSEILEVVGRVRDQLGETHEFSEDVDGVSMLRRLSARYGFIGGSRHLHDPEVARDGVHEPHAVIGDEAP